MMVRLKAAAGLVVLAAAMAGGLRDDRACETSATCAATEACVEGLCQASSTAPGEDASPDASSDVGADVGDAAGDAGGDVTVRCEAPQFECSRGCCDKAPGVNAGVLDLSGDTGFEPSIAVDAKGFPHIAYQDNSNQALRYIRWTGDAWTQENTPEMRGYEASGFEPHLVVSASGEPHIVHQAKTNDADVILSSRLRQGEWNHEVIHSGDAPLSIHSYGLDVEGMGVAYALVPQGPGGDDEPSELVYASNASGAWEIDGSIEDLGVVEHVSLALRPDGSPRILHKSTRVRGFDGGLYDVRRTDLGWPRARAFESSDTLGSVSDVVIDGQNRAHALLWDPGAKELVYATSETFSWVSEVTLSEAEDLSEFEITLREGSPEVVFVVKTRPTEGELKFSEIDDSGRWSSRSLTTFGRPSKPSIAVDGFERTHVAYYDDDDRNLVYTYFDGTDWVVESQ